MIWYAVMLVVGFSLGFVLAALLAASARGRMQSPDEGDTVSSRHEGDDTAEELPASREDAAESPSSAPTSDGGEAQGTVSPEETEGRPANGPEQRSGGTESRG